MMTRDLRPRPSRLIDALDAQEGMIFSGRVWRSVRETQDVLRASRSGGRWDDGTFDVLYTSLTKEGAIAERIYHLSKGQPVIPSKPRYVVHEIEVSLRRVLDLSSKNFLESLGLDMGTYGLLSYVERPREYPTTQQIAEIAHFLEFDALLVPGARAAANNLVIFAERTKPESFWTVGKPEPISFK